MFSDSAMCVISDYDSIDSFPGLLLDDSAQNGDNLKG